MKEKIKIGVIGLGRRGGSLLDDCISDMRDVDIAYICDTNEEALKQHGNKMVEKGRPRPVETTDYHDILRDESIDATVILTGWSGHIQCAIDSMLAGKYTATEVGCAYDLSQCYDLLAAYEKSGSPLMMLENCCYGRRELMALKLAKEQLFGEIVYCAGAYHHYLPGMDILLKDENGGMQDSTHYRLREYQYRNCEQYPTHELGPICKVLGINRGNRLMTLSSFASKSCGIKDYINKELPDMADKLPKEYRQGDITSTNITCANGELIHLTLDTTLRRPCYSREFTVRGTRGCCIETSKNDCVFLLDGLPGGVESEVFERHDHPLYAQYIKEGVRGTHDGMDWLVFRAFFESVKNGTQTPIDIYDTVTLMSIAPLSEMSINLGGAPVNIPDFTKGKWINREPITEQKYSLDGVFDKPEIKVIDLLCK